MSFAIIAPGKDVTEWIDLFQEMDDSLSIQVYPDLRDKESIEAVLVWKHPQGILKELPNLKLICSMGAGVDHILSDPQLPENIPITRIVDDKLTFSMTNYVVTAVLFHHRQIPKYLAYKSEHMWDMREPEVPVTIGVMGTGALGSDVLDKLSYLGFNVIGYGRSRKKEFGFPYYSGDELESFLSKVNVLVCLLPLTPDTEDILNLSFFEKCQRGTYLINVARGNHLVEADLLLAIEKGFISGAFLDVYREEPLPKDHPFWDHPKIMLTPHIASVTNPAAAAPQIYKNYENMKKNLPLVNEIKMSQGY
ncbi:2-hydroxyacid dehydrogenase [Pararhodonellum marinum]|uniref:2-hydroxyacid dehydrogenase n=1 Tax=Pararhodonellum marinum TaxID=2755358 RepID=UPI00188FB1AC|nr:glyoxylate/hydroxypyruvate reductase A [Pararhodonellum marinum]